MRLGGRLAAAQVVRFGLPAVRSAYAKQLLGRSGWLPAIGNRRRRKIAVFKFRKQKFNGLFLAILGKICYYRAMRYAIAHLSLSC